MLQLIRARSRRGVGVGTIYGLGVVTLCLAVTAGTAGATPSTPGSPPRWAPEPQKVAVVPHGSFVPQPPVVKHAATASARADVHWPGAGSSSISIEGATAKAGPTRFGDLPIRAQLAKTGTTAAASVATLARVGLTASLLDHASATRAGVAGVMLTLARSTASASGLSITIDYSSFAHASGADFGQRLHLVALPECALTTPAVTSCRVQTPLPSTNDSYAQTLTATLPTSATATPKTTNSNRTSASRESLASTAGSQMVIAAVSGSGGSNGQFTATSLAPSGTWSVGGAAGDFSWSYPISVPPAAAGAAVAPSVALSYDSGSVDGQITTTNNQSSWVGEGWGYSPGYIERTYRTCASDTTLPTASQTGDECWAGQILNLSMGSRSTAIVRDDSTGQFHLQNDDGSRLNLVGAGPNGYQGEYWVLTTPDGVQYYFGRNILPGGTSATATDSAWTVPVYGGHSGDPCYNATFASASCSQAWRWNLDYVVDPNGNAAAYYYTPETNNYGADNATTNVAYIRSGYLSRIEYGLHLVSGSIYGTAASDKITFGVSDRTDSTGWPDTPTDQDCSSSPSCNNHSPTFWTRKRLTSITTAFYTGSTYQTVDGYALAQSFPTTGDSEMVLNSITRTGYATTGGTSITLPAVSFVYQEMDSRVAGYNNQIAMIRNRLTQITAETGQVTSVEYNQAGRAPALCTASTVPADPSQDSAECFPVVWTPPYNASPIHDYFHKYVATEVDVEDPNGIAPQRITTYTYLGGAAWHYDDNELVKPADRTYAQFRGYGTVQVRTGDPLNPSNGAADKYTLTTTTYYRGMNGDILPSGTRTANVTDSLGESVPDTNDYADTPREVQTFNGDGGAQLSTTITTPTTVATTATRARTGLSALTALMVRTATTRSYTNLAAGGTRLVQTDIAYDSSGRPIQENDTGTSVPTVCTTTTYAANASSSYTNPATPWLRGSVSEVVKSNQTCPTYGTAPSPVLADVRTYYDSSTTLGTVGSQGLATRSDTATTNTSTWAISTIGYDSYGRPNTTTSYPKSTDLTTARTTTTSYTQSTGGQLTGVKVTYPAVGGTAQTGTTILDPARGVTTESVDVAGLKTDGQYDALGRLTSVWQPGQVMGTDPATTTYSYVLKPASVTTKTLVDPGNGATPAYTTSVSIYDAFGTLRQIQTDAVGGGRVVADNFTDSHGWTIRTNNRWVTAGAPAAPTSATSIPTVADSGVDSRTVTGYDGSGRPTLVTQYKGTSATSTTKTVYGGDRTTVVPPTGGVEQTTVTDARGNTTELDRWTTAPTITGSVISGGIANKTTYQYTPLNQQAQLVTAVGTAQAATWSWSYDLAGRVTSQADPDTGTTTSSYDDLGELTSTTDAKLQTLSYVYDALGRKIQSWSGAAGTGTQLASWTYDTLQAGKLTSSTRYTTGGNYTVAATGYDTAGNPAGTTTTIPAPEMGGAAGSTISYTTSYTWTATHLMHTAVPAPAGSLPAETNQYTYDSLGDVIGVSGYSSVLSNATYSAYGEPTQYSLGGGNMAEALNYNYDAQTRRVSSTVLSAQTAIPQIDNTVYSYDLAGNLVRSDDTQGGGSGAPVESQCYVYDALDQLARVWSTTPANTCTASDPTAAAGTTKIGGPQPYWQSWSVDPAGSRTQQVQHAVPGGLAADTTTSYVNGVTGHAHSLAGTSTTGGSTGSTSYVYDADGNTTTRTLSATSSQTLGYTPEGQLDTDTVTSSGTTTGAVGYVYDADGTMLARNDTIAGTNTVYLPGEELSRNTSTGVFTATRYYTVNGTVVSLRVNHGNQSALGGDLHGTNQIAVPNTVSGPGTPVRRYFDPYGNALGTPAGTWPDSHAFLNQPTDTNTGLDDLGARQYDPTTGRFTAADPVLNAGDPASMQGYAYADNNPVTNSDASGTICVEGDSNANCGGSHGGGGHAGGSGSETGSADTNPGPGPTNVDYLDNPPSAPGGGGGGANGVVVDPSKVEIQIPNPNYTSGMANSCGSNGQAYTCGAATIWVPLSSLTSQASVNYCGGLSWLCTALGINQAANCIVHGNNCVGAVIAIAGDVFVVAKVGKLVQLSGAVLTRSTADAAGEAAADTVPALTENQIGSTTEDILANATRGKVSIAVQYAKAGGFDQANADFDLLTRGVDVVDRGGGLRTATLSNGTKVNVRPFSSGKFPTLEIDTPGNPAIKIRY